MNTSKTKLIAELEPFFYPTTEGLSKSRLDKVFKKFISFFTKSNRSFDWIKAYKLIDNSESMLNSLKKILQNPEYKKFFKLNSSGFLYYRFRYLPERETSKDPRSYLTIAVFSMEDMCNDGLLTSNIDYKSIDIYNEKHLKYLVPSFGKEFIKVLKENLQQLKPYGKELHNAYINANQYYNQRIRTVETIEFDKKIMRAIESTQQSFYNELSTLYQNTLEDAQLLANGTSTKDMAFVPGFVGVCLDKIGILKSMQTLFSNSTINLIIDMVTMILVSNRNVIYSSKDDRYKNIKFLSGYIEKSSYSRLTERLYVEMQNIQNNGQNLFANFWSNMFTFNSDLKNIIKDEQIIIDSTSIGSDSKIIPLIFNGRDNSQGGYKKQMRFSLAYTSDMGIPISGRIDRGNQVDKNLGDVLFNNLLDQGYKNLNLVTDRGYYTRDQIASLDSKGFKFTIMSTKNSKVIQELIEDNSLDLLDLYGFDIINDSLDYKQAYGLVRAIDASSIGNTNYKAFKEDYDLLNINTEDKQFYITMFRNVDESVINKKLEAKDVLYKLNKKIIDYDKVDKIYRKHLIETDNLKNPYSYNVKALCKDIFQGQVHVIVTNYKPKNAQEVIDIYHKRNNIEVYFKHLKSMGQGAAQVQSEDNLHTKLILTTLVQTVKKYLSERLTLIRLSESKKINFNNINDVIRHSMSMKFNLGFIKTRPRVIPCLENPQDRLLHKILDCKTEDYNNQIVTQYEMAYSNSNIAKHLKNVSRI